MWIVYHFVFLKVVHCFGRVSSAFNETRTSHKKSTEFMYVFFFSDLIVASWISKTSSLPFLNHMDANNSQFRLALLSNDGSTSERDSREEEVESEATANIKRSHSLTSAQKRALIVKRLIPLVISLLILGGAVAVRFLIPLPSSHETSSFGNDTLTSNTTCSNLTTVIS